MNTDREVAELVMGWTINTGPHPFIPDKEIDFWDTPKGARTLEDFKPKTNIKHAMEVAAEMFSRGYSIEIRHGQNNRWHVVFIKEGLRRCYSLANTLEEAICLAALEAKK